MEDYDNPPRGYDDDGYNRDRSRSPRADRRDENGSRARSASPGSRNRSDERDAPPDRADGENSRNTGSNLFVTGIHPSVSDEDLQNLFAVHGIVEECKIMRDPHTKDSRGFGFVKMSTSDEADAAMRTLQGQDYKGRTLAIEVARRSRPRTPTPGKYYGPPKRDDFRRPRGGGRFGGDRYGDRAYDRGPRGGGYGRYDDYGYRGGSRYEDRYRRDEYGSGGGSTGSGGGSGGGGGYRGGERGNDRYREERYERRGGGGGGGSGYYDRGSYDREGGGRAPYEREGGGRPPYEREGRGSYGGRDERPAAGGPPSYAAGSENGRGAAQPYEERPYP